MYTVVIIYVTKGDSNDTVFKYNIKIPNGR